MTRWQRGIPAGAHCPAHARRLLGMLAIAAAGAGCTPAAYDVHETLSYDRAIGYRGTFDFYEPRGDTVRTGRPAVVAIHGGAWRGGDKAWGEQFAKELTPSGYVVFAINYRLAGDAPWPAQVEDVQKAVRHIRANAGRFRIDPERIASLGMSAGGHLATMVALRPDPLGNGRVDVAVNLDGEHDMTMPPDQVMDDYASIMTDVLGHPAPWSPEELQDISTVTFARPQVAVLTVHGAGDDNVYVAQAERLTAVLRAAGAQASLVRIDGPDGDCHEDCWKVPRARAALHAFLGRSIGATDEGRKGTPFRP